MLRGVRVLVVDHDPGARENLLKVLGITGAETKAARSCTEALDALGGFRPDVLVSAVGAHDDDCYELILDVRALTTESGGCMRAPALTAENHPEDGPRAAASACD